MKSRTVALIIGAALAGASVAGVAAYAAADEKPVAVAATPTAAPTTAAPSPTPSIDKDREACHLLSQIEGNVELHFDQTAMWRISLFASQAQDPDIATAGSRLVDIFTGGDPEPGPESLEAMDASLALAEACAGKYGDGPW